jgi:hypothetical protein
MQLALETLDSQSRIALARDYVVELAKQQIAQKLATQLGELSKQLQSQPKILEEALAEVQAAVGEALVRYSSLDGADPEFEDLREIFNRPSESNQDRNSRTRQRLEIHSARRFVRDRWAHFRRQNCFRNPDGC